MQISIDISQMAYKGTGVARYTKAMISALMRYDHTNDYTLFFSSLRLTVDPSIQKHLVKNMAVKEFKLPPAALDITWNRLHILPVETFVGQVDIFFSSDWTQPPTKSAKTMTTIHDLIALKYPETQHATIVETQKRRLAWVQKEVQLILCDSEATKKDVIELLQIPEERLTVVYPAVEICKLTEPPPKPEKPFILSVGKLEPRKNIPRLIEAFQKANLPNYELVIVGAKGWGDDPAAKPVENVRFAGFVSDEELAKLYLQATFFVFPSLYEGFGYPVAEAMAHGCPVATSNTSSMAEIAGDAGLLFDPHNVDSIVEALQTLSSDAGLRENLKLKGLARAELFTPARFAQALTTCFTKLYDQNRH